MTAPLLEVEDLHVAFGSKTVVEGASFSIAPGEKLALVGESGSGKTVTALALLRLLHEARLSGHARFDDGRRSLDLLGLPEREMRALRGDQMRGHRAEDPLTDDFTPGPFANAPLA